MVFSIPSSMAHLAILSFSSAWPIFTSVRSVLILAVLLLSAILSLKILTVVKILVGVAVSVLMILALKGSSLARTWSSHFSRPVILIIFLRPRVITKPFLISLRLLFSWPLMVTLIRLLSVMTLLVGGAPLVSFLVLRPMILKSNQ